jgi:hypothetical protein
MAILTNTRINGTPAALLDAEGRAIEHLPGRYGRTLLEIDTWLRDAGMTFLIECQQCSRTYGQRVWVVPATRDGRVEFTCPHARRVSDLVDPV